MVFASNALFATHNRAGEITYVQKGPYTFEITLITYTYTKAPADRPELDIYFGDGTFSTVPRNLEEYLPDDYKRNRYQITHTYPGAGTFVISIEDQNRNEGVVNIPNSVNIVFAVKTILQINPVIGSNSTPEMLNPPIDKAARNQIFVHNPNAFDPDGDSLSYKMAICLGDGANPIPNYTLPEAKNEIKVDPVSGDLIWNYPETLGIFNVAVEISEWRRGVRIGTIIRDMQIEVVETDNLPPTIDPLADHCVEADSTLIFKVTAHDEATEKVTISSTGGVYDLDISPAFFKDTTALGTVNSDFRWTTDCSHVRKQPYLVIFKASDDNPDQVLVTYKNVNIYVLGPAPENIQLEPTNNSIFVQWDSSLCEEVAGYKIYRKNRRAFFTPGECEVGVPAYTEYEFIGSVAGWTNTEFIDDDNGLGLVQGYEYCYMIVAYYADGAESFASEEYCTELSGGVPIMLKASVSTTDQVNGAIHLQWLEPLDFDSVANPGPYRYQIYRSDDLNGTAFTDPVIVNGLHTTTYIDTNYNTLEKPRMYKMGLFNYNATSDVWNIIGVPERAASPFLTLLPGDNQIELQLGENVPWTNYQYVIIRKTMPAGVFDTIAYTTGNKYLDKGLTNGLTYCYKIKCLGEYGLDTIPSPLINYSQEACAIPIDTVPPCPPVLTLVNNCDSAMNELRWTNPNHICSNDVISYKIYYTPGNNIDYQLIKTIDDPNDTVFIHYPEKTLAGCYYIIAIDSFQNESAGNNFVCADICDYYNLPNSFTPDGNGINDIFKPFPYQLVEKVDIKIYSRYGGLIFQTDNPDINWDGRNMITKQMVASGVYYYVCDVWEYRLTGLEVRNLTGFINVFSGGGSKTPD